MRPISSVTFPDRKVIGVQNTSVKFYDFAEKVESAGSAGTGRNLYFHGIPCHRRRPVLWRIINPGAEGQSGRRSPDSVCDVGSVGFLNLDFIKRMKEKNIQCRVFNPVFPVLKIFMNNQDHRKITIIDGKVGFTGGYNLADEC